jgi:hypothetical protein
MVGSFTFTDSRLPRQVRSQAWTLTERDSLTVMTRS